MNLEVSTVVLWRWCLSNFKAIGQFYTQIIRLLDFVRSFNMTPSSLSSTWLSVHWHGINVSQDFYVRGAEQLILISADSIWYVIQYISCNELSFSSSSSNIKFSYYTHCECYLSFYFLSRVIVKFKMPAADVCLYFNGFIRTVCAVIMGLKIAP